MEKANNKIVITVPLSYSTLNNSTNVITYTVYPTGDIVVNSEFDSSVRNAGPRGYEDGIARRL